MLGISNPWQTANASKRKSFTQQLGKEISPMSYIDEKVKMIIEDMSYEVAVSLDQNGLDDYGQTVRKAFQENCEYFAGIIRESFQNGLRIGRIRSGKQSGTAQKASAVSA